MTGKKGKKIRWVGKGFSVFAVWKWATVKKFGEEKLEEQEKKTRSRR